MKKLLIPLFTLHFSLFTSSALAAEEDVTYDLAVRTEMRHVIVDHATASEHGTAWEASQAKCESPIAGAFTNAVGNSTASSSPDLAKETLVTPETARGNVLETSAVGTWRLAWGRVGRTVTRVRAQFALGDVVTAPLDLPAGFGDIDWYKTYQKSAAYPGQANTFFCSASGDTADATMYFAAGGDAVTVSYVSRTGQNETRVYRVSSTASSRPYRLYRTDAPYGNSPVSLSGQFVKLVGSDDLLACTYDVTVITNINAGGSVTNVLVTTNGVTRGVYLNNGSLYCVGDVKGQFLLAYYDSADCTRVLDVQVIEACTPSVKVVSALVGDQLKPQADGYDIAGLYPQVVASSRTTYDDRGDFIYVNSGVASYAPHRNAAFAIRPTYDEGDRLDHTWDATIDWYAPDELGTEWPFEQTQYSVRWGDGVKLLVTGEPAAPGQMPIFPEDWTVSACAYQQPDGILTSTTDADGASGLVWRGAGKSLLKITGPNADGDGDIAFVQVTSVLAKDADYRTTQCPIGQPALPSVHGAAAVTNASGVSWLGYIHEPWSALCFDDEDYVAPSAALVEGSSDTVAEEYLDELDLTGDDDGDIADVDDITDSLNGLSTATYRSDIFFVNRPEPTLPRQTVEVWWNTAFSAGDLAGTAYLPTFREQFVPTFPDENATEQIVLASQKGSAAVSVWRQGGETVWHTNAVIEVLSGTVPKVYAGGTNAVDGTGRGWSPNVTHAWCDETDDGAVCWALRCDMKVHSALEHPFVYLKGQDPDGNRKVWIYYVMATNAAYAAFSGDVLAGNSLPGPHPLDLRQDPWVDAIWWKSPSDFSKIVPYRDRKGLVWARRDGTFDIHMYYPSEESFAFTYLLNGVPRAWEVSVPVRTSLPWNCELVPNQIVNTAQAGAWTWTSSWPSGLPTMKVAETLTKAQDGVAEVWNASSAAVLWPPASGAGASTDARGNTTAQITDPTCARTCSLAFDSDFTIGTVLGKLGFSSDPGGNCVYRDGATYFLNLPGSIGKRLYFDPNATLTNCLVLVGRLDERSSLTDILYPNVLTASERTAVKALVADDNPYKGRWNDAIDAFATAAILPNGHRYVQRLSPSGHTYWEYATDYSPVDHYALATLGGGERGETNYVVWIENDADPDAGLGVQEDDPVSMHVFAVLPEYYLADCVTRSDENNLLSQFLDVVYTDPLGGKPEDFYFEWECAEPNADGTMPSEKDFHTSGRAGVGLTRFTLGTQGAMTDILKNTYWRVHYRARPGTTAADLLGTGWSGYTEPCLAESWIQRVIDSVTPFTQRVTDLYDNPPETTVSMLRQIGGPYQGDVALNMDNLTEVGLLETYMTLLNKAESMSIAMGPSASIDDTEVNKQLMQLVERMDDFYMLLGNEAFSDAANPTIACSDPTSTSSSTSTSSLHLGSTFCFDNQVATLLDEELALLRGRDVLQEESEGSDLMTYREKPCYNRLLWNFTRGITAGEVAYAMNYDIYATGEATDIDADSAAAAYPQGHGDAWGHYLNGLKLWYRLLRNPSFTWEVSMGEMNVDDHPVNVDYYEEEKMAEAAAALGKTAQRVVDMTARKVWRDRAGTVSAADAGYEDKLPARAFGCGEWANRGGVACFANWVIANSLLPAADTNETAYTDEGLLRINRSTVTALKDLASRYDAVQRTTDRLNANLNPLGLAENAVPFGLSPAAADGSESQFEQSVESAETALRNANALLEKASEATAALRELSYAEQERANDADQEESDFNNRLIALYGYPYDGDIGAGKTYPEDYSGPDLYHWMYVDRELLKGMETSELDIMMEVDQVFSAQDGTTVNIAYGFSRTGYVVKPDSVTGSRRAWGKLQYAYTEYLDAVGRFNSAARAYQTASEAKASLWKFLGNVLLHLNSIRSNLKAQKKSSAEEKARKTLQSQVDLIQSKALLKNNYHIALASSIDHKTSYQLTTAGENPSETTGDTRTELTLEDKMLVDKELKEDREDLSTQVKKVQELCDKESKELDALIKYQRKSAVWAGLANIVTDIANYVKQRKQVLSDLAAATDALSDAALGLVEPSQKILSLKAEGEAIQDERTAARLARAKKAAKSRYSDMAHRLYRDEALDRYADAFDIAQCYTWLAAKAYDYETGGAITAGDERSEFLDEIVGTRLPGEVQADGSPMRWGGTGDAGLSDVLARLKENYAVAKPRLGINNPQGEITWFSLRTEAFRILPGADGLNTWRNKLDTFRVSSLKSVPAYARLCSGGTSSASSSGGTSSCSSADEPALVIPLSTVIEKGKNFFGNDLAGGESRFSESYFATKIAEAGVELVGYDGSVFSATPYVYLVPAGRDVMRAPATGEAISFDVADQVLPVPNILGSKALDADWSELYVNLTGQTAGNVKVRKYPAFRARLTEEGAADAETSASTLIGRSVWNTEWVLIIPGSSLRADGDTALKEFIWGNAATPGVSDIKIGFRTYSHWGQ